MIVGGCVEMHQQSRDSTSPLGTSAAVDRWLEFYSPAVDIRHFLKTDVYLVLRIFKRFNN